MGPDGSCITLGAAVASAPSATRPLRILAQAWDFTTIDGVAMTVGIGRKETHASHGDH
jgi:hypothetical protein